MRNDVFGGWMPATFDLD